MMLAPPQVVGVLLKKPGQQSDPRVPPVDPQETKIRGELYVEDLNERRIVSIKMGWLWVESTQMKLPLRALNLRQASPGICQPHVLALGFTLSNSQGDLLATFWADTEPIYWSWVRAIAAELVRQTPFRAQRCLNFLEILTICPRGPLPLPDSPTETRRRSRSELRCWLSNSPMNKKSARSSSILEDSRRRARSELRGWSSSNSSDEDLHLAEFRGIESSALPKIETSLNGRAWACSESSEGSDDSLPWGAGCRSSVDSIDSSAIIPEADTRELRIQRYKEARRRENEARSRRVLEEDALRRKARLEENNNNNNNIINSHKNDNQNNNNNNNETTILGTTAKTGETCNIGCRESSRVTKNDRLEEKQLKSVKQLESIKQPDDNKKSDGDERKEESRKTTKIVVETGIVRDEESQVANLVDLGRRSVRNRERISASSGNNRDVARSTMNERLSRTLESVETIGRGSAGRESSVGEARLNGEGSRKIESTDPFVRAAETVDSITRRLPPLKVSLKAGRSTTVGFRESDDKNDRAGENGSSSRCKPDSPPSPGVVRTDSGERRSRARERRNVRDKCQAASQSIVSESSKTSFLEDRKEPSRTASRIPIASREPQRVSSNSRITGNPTSTTSRVDEPTSKISLSREFRERGAVSLPRTTMTILPIVESVESSECETDVAVLLARCQRVDHYVPVREKLTLFESLSRMGGRLARSTEDLGRSLNKPSPRGKQRARSLHDLNRAARSVPVREMCRLFEGDREHDDSSVLSIGNAGKFGDNTQIAGSRASSKDQPVSILKSNNNRSVPACVRTSTRRKHYQK